MNTERASWKNKLQVGDRWDVLRGHIGDSALAALTQMQSASSRVTRLMFRDRSVPLFLLPTGSGPNDFYCLFQFDEVLSQLRSGVLVRPVLEVWAGRPDPSREHLADVLKEEFTRQFREAKEKERQNVQAQIAAMGKKTDAERQKKLDASVIAAGTVTISLIAILLLNPIGDLIALMIVLFGGRAAIKSALEYLRLSKDAKDQRKLGRKLSQFDAQLSSKNKAFVRAVTALEIHIHPVFQDLTKVFCEVDGLPFAPAEVDEDAAVTHDIRAYLHAPEYLSRVPSEYRPLLDTF